MGEVKWFYVSLGVFILGLIIAPLTSERVAKWTYQWEKRPLGSENFYLAGIGAAAVLLVAAVLAAQQVTDVDFGRGWLQAVLIVVPLLTILLLVAAISKGLDALLHCHAARARAPEGPRVCGTYGQEAYTEYAVWFGSLLLFLQAAVVFGTKVKPDWESFKGGRNKDQAERSVRSPS